MKRPTRSHLLTLLVQALLGLALLAGSTAAAEPSGERSDPQDTNAQAAQTPERRGLQPLDWSLIFAYAGSTLALGWYYGRKQKSTEEYFVGSGNMNPVLIGVSLFATLLSTISYLSMPGESLGKGPAHMATLLGYPLVFLVVGYVLLPVYMRQRVTSAYELLELKLGLGIRLMGALMFIALRLVWMSLLVYLAAKAMTVMLGVGDEWIVWIVLATGLVAVIYTSLGGLQAVVITDFMQTMLLFGGALLVLLMVTIDMGGFGWFPTEWKENWDVQPLISADPATRVTVVGSFLSMFIWFVCTAGGDQTSVQRFMATRDARAARRAYAVQLTTSALVAIVLGLVGFALLAYFEAHLDELPANMTLKDNADDIFPRYIAFHLPVGVSGLVVAAMFAAAMSSIDSGVNSITAVVMSDFFDRLGWRVGATERRRVLSAKLMAFAIGGVVVVGSSFVEHVPGNITGVTQKTTNLLTTPIFALFFFALFVPFAKPLGVLAGATAGISSAVLIAFSGPIFGVDPRTGGDPISFQWIPPVALAANLITGTLVSLVLPAARKRAGAKP